MSGPKVVHVVIKEEVEAACRRWLVLVGEAASDLERVAARLGRMDAVLRAQVQARRSAIEGMTRAEKWLDLQKDAPLAIEHFRFESGRLRAEAVAAATAERSKRRRVAEAARSVASSLGRPASRSRRRWPASWRGR